MTDDELVTFLQWALPQLGLRWPGFRRVRRQLRKRLARRLAALGLSDLAAYRAHLERDAAEWRTLDPLCRISISRFFRDRAVYDALGHELAARAAAAAREGRPLFVWSAGCASGEEPYSVAILWRLSGLAARFNGVDLAVLATDADERLLARARRARYPVGCLREVPTPWREAAFFVPPSQDEALCELREPWRRAVRFVAADLRRELPAARFDLLLCRNLAFTYFDLAQQRAILAGLAARLQPDGVLVIGGHERLPDDDGAPRLARISPGLPIYRPRCA